MRVRRKRGPREERVNRNVVSVCGVCSAQRDDANGNDDREVAADRGDPTH
jgi:hypothetical protein